MVSGSSCVMPQPVLWVSATTPSTLGKSANGLSCVNGFFLKISATMPATCALQFTDVRMPIVAGRHPSIGPADAVEGCRQIEIRHRLDVDAKGVILGEIAHAAILRMDVLARRN